MAVAHESTVNPTPSNVNSLTSDFVIPAAATTGRLIVLAFIQRTSTTPTITLPTGFVTGASGTLPGTGRYFEIAYKIAASGDAGATRTITSDMSASWAITCSVYSGIDTTTPVVATGSFNSGTMSTVSLVMSAITMTRTNSWLYAFYGNNGTASVYSTATMTERSEFQQAGVGVGSADEAVAASGSTGTRTITSSVTGTSWGVAAIGINPSSAVATLTQTTFRGRNDDGSETTATWKATAGTDWTQLVDTNFRVRFNVNDSVAAATQNTAFVLRYSLNGGAYTAVSASSSVVRAFASANVADGAATTEQLAGSGTFNAGTFDEVDGSATGFTAATATGQDTEVEYSVQIRGVDVANGDTINLRVYDNAGVALNGGYTDTPVITVSKPAAAASLVIPTETAFTILRRR